MSKTFDIGLETLSGSGCSIGSASSIENRDRAADGSGAGPGATSGAGAIGGALRGTFFLETFGCQMNDHDSEKVAGVLLSRGYRQVGSPELASLVLYNTCSIREKAAQKVFSR